MTDATLDTSRPFRLRSGRRAGYTDHQLRGPMFRRLFRDCFVSSATPVTPSLLVRGALLVRPKAEFATHHSAARVLGGIVPDEPDVHLGSTHDIRSRRDGIVVHRYAEKPRVVRLYGVHVTEAAQTFLDLAGLLPLVDLVVFGDSVVRRGRVTPAQLVTAAKAHHGRGARAARAAAALVRAEVDSPQETRTRLLLVLAGLPEPTVNIKIRDADGEIVRRIDMGYESYRLAVEYDGRQHIERQESWAQDIGRREELGNEQWRFVILIADDLTVTPQDTLDRVVRAMRAAGMTVPRLRNDWMRHFPGRKKAA